MKVTDDTHCVTGDGFASVAWVSIAHLSAYEENCCHNSIALYRMSEKKTMKTKAQDRSGRGE